MSREFKFRAWDSDRARMFTHCKWADWAINHEGVLSAVNYARDYSEQRLVIMQYTGLKDANGVDIYEGDLLRIPANNKYEETTFNCFEVFYHDNECIGGQNIGFCMNRMHPQGHSAGGHGYKFTPESISKNGFVVAGNIYENPEIPECGP